VKHSPAFGLPNSDEDWQLFLASADLSVGSDVERQTDGSETIKVGSACPSAATSSADQCSLVQALPGEESAPYRTIGTPPVNIPFKYSYYHLDHLGSPRILTDGSGIRIQGQRFLPFGEEMPIEAGMNSRKFTGHERDSETGMDYMMARYYSANYGRFVRSDPNKLRVAVTDTRKWNMFGYVEMEPVNAYDPDGRASIRSRSLRMGKYQAGTAGCPMGELCHMQIFFDDGTPDVGYFDLGGFRSDAHENMGAYVINSSGYDDKVMKQAVENVKKVFGAYKAGINDCHDFVLAVLLEYQRLNGPRPTCPVPGKPPKNPLNPPSKGPF
jgi:RHS repeat-associated protein